MALRQLMISKKIEQRKASLAELLTQEEGFNTRSSELETSIEEAKTDEEIAFVEEEITKLDADKVVIDEKKGKLEGEIAELEGELEKLNSNEPKNNPEPTPAPQKSERNKGDEKIMARGKFFGGMTRDAVRTLVEREEVKEFLVRAREFGSQQRSVTGTELLIPEIMLDLLRDNISGYSKLIGKVNLKPLKGKARQNITGTVPEAVWMEMTGALNELTFGFNQIEMDGYKVGGFIAIPNSTLQDSDLNLASEILSQLGKAIGIAIDKAILFGIGVKQPLGIVTRLAQTTKPGTYSDKAPVWKDLHTTNILKTASTGIQLVSDIITGFGACKNNYSNGEKFFVMNSTTKSYLITTLLNFNAAGAIATGMNNQMPIIGGEIIELDFIEGFDIIGGYADLYTLAEREGTNLASSDQVKFIEEITLFKGSARYDGMPVIAEGFFVINIKNTNATTTTDFEVDYANTELGALGVTSVAGTLSGDTLITVTGAEASGTTLGYKIAGKVASVKSGDSNTGYTTFTTPDDITAATGKVITMVEFDAAGRAIKVGSAQVVAKA